MPRLPYLLLSAVALIASPATAYAQAATPGASTDIHTPTGEWIATASFSQAPDQVLISINFRNRTALVGTHGVHIHTVAQCYPPGYESAGGILNPSGKQHGLLNPDGPMAGDLPNLVIGPAGIGVYNLSTPSVTLTPGPTSLLGPKGTSLVIFAQPDDDRSQPEGNAGQRIACGAIVAGGTSVAAAPGTSAAPAPSSGIDPLSAALIAVLGGLFVAGGIVLRRQRPRT